MTCPICCYDANAHAEWCESRVKTLTLDAARWSYVHRHKWAQGSNNGYRTFTEAVDAGIAEEHQHKVF